MSMPDQASFQSGPGFSKRPVYDLIVVGGGSAGAVLAPSLSEDPNVRVRLVATGALGTAPSVMIGETGGDRLSRAI